MSNGIGAKARVIITESCHRNCPNCANTQSRTIAAIKNLYSIEELDRFDEVIITGGEPMLVPDEVAALIQEIRKQKSTRKIFLYSAAIFDMQEFTDIVDIVDGLHYTIHSPASNKDIQDFQLVQSILAEFRGQEKSFRLYIQEGVQQNILLNTSVWSRIELKPWQEDCPIPEGEELLLWKG